MRWHTKPVIQLVVMFLVMFVVVGAQSSVSALFGGKPQSQLTMMDVQDTGLRQVAGSIADPTCPNTDAVNYAWTENNIAIAPPRRMRYTAAPWEYDTLNTTYFSRTDSPAEFDQAGNVGSKSDNMVIQPDDPNKDPLIANIMSSIFRYKPTAFKNVYLLKYAAAPRGNDTPHKGMAPAVEVPSKSGWPVCVPTTGYDIGGGYEAMVVAAESSRITLHIGIHEYMVGSDPALGGCPAGQPCKGGYWLYISGINVDSDILAAYNLKKGIQQGAGLAQEISTRIELPIVKPGRRLGTSRGDGVVVLLRDSGPIINANKNFMWGGGFPEYDAGTPANTPPPAGTATPMATPTRTASPTAVPTLPPPAAGKGNIQMKVKNRLADLPCSAQLVGFVQLNPGGANPLHVTAREMSNFSQNQEEILHFTNLDPGAYLYRSDYGLYNPNDGTVRRFGQSSMAAPTPINVVADATTNVQQDITEQGASFAECVGATSVPPTATPPQEVVPTVEVEHTGDITTFRIIVTDTCTEPFCDSLRIFIGDIQSGEYEGTQNAALYWNVNSQELSAGIGNLTYLDFGTTTGTQGFSFNTNDPRFPGAYNNAQTMRVRIPIPDFSGGGSFNFTLK